jgi:uncharacterized protein (TIGR04255 family)
MPRTRKARILTKAPLVYTLGQVIFSPIFSIGDYINHIQEQLRKNGFPKVAPNPLQTLTMGPGNIPSVQSVPGWSFLNKTDDFGITLTSNFVSLDTTVYTKFDDLIDQFRVVLDILKSSTDVALVQRIGLRYVDLIKLNEGESFSDYLRPELVGFRFQDVEASNTDYVSHSTANTDSGKLLVRCFRTNSGIPLPPDLLPPKLKSPASVVLGEWVTFLDFDHYNEEQRDFVVDDIIEFFWKLHDITGDAFFNNAITAHAKTQWGLIEHRDV